MNDKEIRVLSTPDEPNSWPTPPVYESPWPTSRIRQVIQAFGVEHGAYALKEDFDKLYSEALFCIWQLEGLLKGKE